MLCKEANWVACSQAMCSVKVTLPMRPVSPYLASSMQRGGGGKKKKNNDAAEGSCCRKQLFQPLRCKLTEPGIVHSIRTYIRSTYLHTYIRYAGCTPYIVFRSMLRINFSIVYGVVRTPYTGKLFQRQARQARHPFLPSSTPYSIR